MMRIKLTFGRAIICVGLMVGLAGTTGIRPALAAPSWSRIMKTFKPG